MLEINTAQLKALEASLGDLNTKGIPFAQRNTVNDMAFATLRLSRGHIRSEFVNRNQWTARSVGVDRAKSTRDSAEVGSTEAYMADQEFGRTKTEHTQMATPAASGESNRAAVRRRPVRRRNRMAAISLGPKGKRMGSRAQQNIVAVKEAKASGRKFVYLDRGRVKGIYQVFGTKKNPRTRMIQNMSRRVAIVPRNPWLAPSSAKAMALGPALYEAQLLRQLDRLVRVR
jgi:hypothetical protein